MPDYPDFPEAPPTSIKSIEGSEFKQEIFNMFLSGWSPGRVYNNIKRLGETIPIRDLAAYQKQIPEEWKLEPSELAKAMKRIDVEVDALLIMRRVILLLEQRLDEALLHARITHQQDAPIAEDKRAVSSLIEKRAKLLFDYCRKYALTLSETGQMVPPFIQLERRDRITLPASLRDILEGAVIEIEPQQIEGAKNDGKEDDV